MDTNVSFSIPQSHSQIGQLSVMADSKCKGLKMYLTKFEKHKAFYENFSWLILTTSVSSGENLLKDLNIDINSDIHLAVQDQSNSYNREIYDAYNPSRNHGGDVIIKKIGKFSTKRGYILEKQSDKYWRRKNMTGLTFKSAVVIPQQNEILSLYLESEEHREINSMHRFQSSTIMHCRDYYNFSLHMQRTESWGYIQKDGKFDGLVRLLQERSIDFGGSPLLLKYDRLPFVEYSFGNWILRSSFIFRKLKRKSESTTIFLQPFDTEVWVLILIFMIILLIALKISFSMKPSHIVQKQGLDSRWSMMFLFVTGAFCQQGAICCPLSPSSRVLFICVFIFCILIYQFYSASIVSYMLLDSSISISSLKDLLESNLQVGIEDILIDRNYFVQTKDLVAIELFKKKINKLQLDNDTGFYEPTDALPLVRKGGFAFHVETSTAYPIIEKTFSNQEICELGEVQMYRTQPMYTNLPKHSPFKEMINYCMLRLVEEGLMFRLRRFWDARKPGCIESEKKIDISVSLKDITCGLLVLGSGIFITFLVLLMEFITMKWPKINDRFKSAIEYKVIWRQIKNR
ncbi:hypothetical protein WA026_004921 [Henosepilachna vigintioctopunctata]|uniref:Uncharacterized protein n=1 Tax=Henosepilachna vigintioctopunctata TaxID=420089 RepID=A0AAW1UVJ7_9CUCU